MVKFDKEDLLRVAALSAIELDDAEIDLFAEQLHILLSYTAELAEVSTKTLDERTSHNPNVYRDDRAIQSDASRLVEEAPKTKDSFVVVPKIIS